MKVKEAYIIVSTTMFFTNVVAMVTEDKLWCSHKWKNKWLIISNWNKSKINRQYCLLVPSSLCNNQILVLACKHINYSHSHHSILTTLCFPSKNKKVNMTTFDQLDTKNTKTSTLCTQDKNKPHTDTHNFEMY